MDWILITIITLALISPAIGALIGIIKIPSDFLMVNILSFGAAILLGIAFLELIPESLHHAGEPLAIIGVISGALLFHYLIPHMHHNVKNKDKDLSKTTWYLFWGVVMHNLPAGIMLASGAVLDHTLTTALAIGLIVHNLPEGIIISSPFYKIFKNRWKAFLLGAATTIPLIIGFLAAFFLFQNLPEILLGFIIAMAAGLILYLTADELIPVVSQKVSKHSTILSFMAGVVVVMIMETILHAH